MTVTELIFTKLTFARHLFENNSYTNAMEIQQTIQLMMLHRQKSSPHKVILFIPLYSAQNAYRCVQQLLFCYMQTGTADSRSNLSKEHGTVCTHSELPFHKWQNPEHI